MSFKTIAATAAFSLSTLVAGHADAGFLDGLADAIADATEQITDAAEDVLSAQTCASGEGIVTDAVDGVTHDWSLQSGYRDDAFVFAQAVTHNGGDAGAVRIDGAKIKFQESTNGNHTSGETVHTFAVCEVPGNNFGSYGEAGAFDLTAASQTTMHYVDFDGAYDNPVFFAQVATNNGSHPIVVTPVLVDGDGAWVALMEPTTYDGSHAEETVHWMVLEAGSYELDDGAYLTVGALGVVTDDYSVAGMETVVPTVDVSGNYVQSDTEYCLENARIKTQSQWAIDTDYHGTRVEQNVDADGVLESFGVRFMRRQGVETAANPASSSGVIGYMVIGDPSSTECSRDEEDFDWYYDDFEGDVGSASDSPFDAQTSILSAFCDEASTIDRVWSQSDDWGNSTVGADYSMEAGMRDDRNDGGELWMGASADAHVTLLGEDLTLLDVGVEATTQADGSSDSQAWLVALEGVLANWGSTGAASFDKTFADLTFLEASAVFYGVTVTASAVGSIGVDGTATLGAASVTLDAGPNASISGEASASIGALCVSAGISSSLTLVEVDVPTYVTAQLQGDSVLWSIDTDLVLSSLDGSLDLFVEYCIDDQSYELFAIDGFSTTYDLISESGCF